MDTMKAIRMSQYGGREVLTFEEVPTPQIAQDEVLVKVVATSVNPFDWAARSGYVAEYYAYTFPHILGLDVSGVVEAVGSHVKGFCGRRCGVRPLGPLQERCICHLHRLTGLGNRQKAPLARFHPGRGGSPRSFLRLGGAL